jgi:tetratricopeptide (TPR) repeat protein
VINTNDHILKRLKGLVIKRPGLVLGLWGEAGIGKTHTAAYLLRETSYKNLSLHVTTPLSSLAKALPKPKALPVWAERIFEKLERNEVLSSEQTSSAFGAVLSEIAPFILHLEDIHEASVERLGWIQALARVVTRLKGVALIVTSRTEPPEPFETIRLEKLDFEGIKNLLEIEARAALPLEALEWIHGKAAGNPLFTLEFFRFLARLGFVWNDGKKWRWRKPEHEVMPVSIETIIQHELTKAGNFPEVEEILCALTLLPVGSGDLLASVLGLTIEVVQQAMKQLSNVGVVSGNDFSHPLYREVKKQLLTVEQRRVFARKCLVVFEYDPDQAVRYLDDAALEPNQTLIWYQRAILTAKTAGRELEHAHLLAKSLTFQKADALPTFALQAAKMLLEWDQSEAFRLAQISFESPQTKLEAAKILVEILSKQGHYQEALELLNTLPKDSLTHQERLFWLVQIENFGRNYQEIMNLWQQHPKLADDPETALCIAMALGQMGRYDEFETFLNKLLQHEHLNDQQKSRVFNLQGILFLNQGKYLKAIEHFDQLIQLYEKVKPGMSLASALYNRCLALRNLSRVDEAISDFKKIRQICFDIGNFVRWSHVNIGLASLFREMALFEDAESLLLESITYLRSIELSDILVECEAELCLLYLQSGLPHGVIVANKYALSALVHARETGIHHSLVHALWVSSQAACQSGFGEKAFELAEEMQLLAQASGNQNWISDANGALGAAALLLGRHEAALNHLRKAKQAAQNGGSVLGEKKVDLEIARLNKDFVQAKAIIVWFETQGFATFADHARQYFPDSELNLQPEPASKSRMLHLELLGAFQITFENTPQTVRGRKRQELLVLLLEARIVGRSEITRLELLDALYPDDDEDRAASSLKELIRGTRANLGAEVIQTTPNGYVLGQVTSDVEEFLKTGDSSLWRGGYLQGLEFTSSETMRESLEFALQTCIQKLLKADAKEASRVSRFLLEMNLYDLGHLRLCIQALKASDNYKTLGRVYSDARERLNDVGETLPERWQDFLETPIPA